jgi:hypothetical protein
MESLDLPEDFISLPAISGRWYYQLLTVTLPIATLTQVLGKDPQRWSIGFWVPTAGTNLLSPVLQRPALFTGFNALASITIIDYRALGALIGEAWVATSVAGGQFNLITVSCKQR